MLRIAYVEKRMGGGGRKTFDEMIFQRLEGPRELWHSFARPIDSIREKSTLLFLGHLLSLETDRGNNEPKIINIAAAEMTAEEASQ